MNLNVLQVATRRGLVGASEEGIRSELLSLALLAIFIAAISLFIASAA
jgi:hypothetical protein